MEMMEYRNDSSYHWIFKQLDHLVGLSFSTDFHFALIALLVKGKKSSSLCFISVIFLIFDLLLKFVKIHETYSDDIPLVLIKVPKSRREISESDLIEHLKGWEFKRSLDVRKVS